MNLATKINKCDRYKEAYDKWLSGAAMGVSTQLSTSKTGLDLLFRIIAIAGNNNISGFVEGKEKAKLFIISSLDSYNSIQTSIRLRLSDYLDISNEDYDNVMDSIKHKDNDRSKYETSPTLLSLYDFLYLVEDKYRGRTSYDLYEIFILSHMSSLEYVLDKDEVFELFSSLMVLLNSK